MKTFYAKQNLSLLQFKKYLLPVILMFINISLSSAQQRVQTLRGTVVDKDSKQPLIGVTVTLSNTNPMVGTVTDQNGEFKIKNVSIGRKNVHISYVGYKDQDITNIEIISGKETVLSINLEESITNIQEVSVVAKRNKTMALNEMSNISARTFSIEESGRYAGSRNDVSRMASNYAGVSNGDDSRNDIIIRGNSPAGLLWKLEELEIPSPNHFTGVGSSGGPVSMLNYNVIANSDFMTGAFPAEFGNASSGVFDIKMRNGNNDKREYMVQAGALGTEFMLEGPFRQNYKGSYLVNYRFSTTSILSAMGVKFGYSGQADYQDISFNFNIPTGNKTTISFFGLGGRSIYKALFKDKKEADFSPDGYLNTNNHYVSATAMTGISGTFRISDNSYFKTIIGATTVLEEGKEDSVALDYSNVFPNYRANNYQYRFSWYNYVKTKIDARNKIKAGIIAERQMFQIKTFAHNDTLPERLPLQRAGDGNIDLIQMYMQWSHSFTEKLVVNSGLHYQYLGLNGNQVIEPRINLKWNFLPKQSLSLGYGLHSQMQLLPVYFVATSTGNGTINTNKDLEFNKSNQFILGYNIMLSQNTALKIETYYQQLFDIPVNAGNKLTSFSAINEGMSYIFTDEDSLVNKGTGRNVGMELTLEKFFSNGYYYLITASLFDSKYKGSDGVLRNTAFNGQYVFNTLVGKEFLLNEKSKIVVDIKVSTAGGKRYTPIDIDASRIANQAIRNGNEAYSQKFDNYFRTDLKVTYRFNGLGRAHEFFINVDNLFNNKNIFAQSYDTKTNQLSYIYQLGMFPTFQYKLYF